MQQLQIHTKNRAEAECTPGWTKWQMDLKATEGDVVTCRAHYARKLLFSTTTRFPASDRWGQSGGALV